jgi:hypothetical protein
MATDEGNAPEEGEADRKVSPDHPLIHQSIRLVGDIKHCWFINLCLRKTAPQPREPSGIAFLPPCGLFIIHYFLVLLLLISVEYFPTSYL